MLNIDKALKEIDRLYSRGDIFRAYIKNEDIFPRSFKLNRVTQKDFQNSYSQIQKDIERLKRLHLSVEYRDYNFKTLGTQRLPSSILIQSLDEFLKIIGKRREYQEFRINFDFVTQQYPLLTNLFLQKPFLVLDYRDIWGKLLRVVSFLLENPNPNIYIREISIEQIDTKFIENHKKIIDILISTLKEISPLNTLSSYSFEKRYSLKYPQPIVRFRLDRSYFGFEDISLTIDEFRKIDIDFERVFIIENKTTFLSFPIVKDSIIIFGEGYGVSKLDDIDWLKEIDILYWGDIDIDGFAILSQVRRYYPQTKSLLMDIDTFKRYKDFAVTYKQNKIAPKLDNLTIEEQGLYENLLLENGIRLEQEQIPFNDILKRII